jgi:hypothetical protein
MFNRRRKVDDVMRDINRKLDKIARSRGSLTKESEQFISTVLSRIDFSNLEKCLNELSNTLDNVEKETLKHSYDYFEKNFSELYNKILKITESEENRIFSDKIMFFDLDEEKLVFYKSYLESLEDEKIVLKHLINIIDTVPIDKTNDEKVLEFLKPFKSIMNEYLR